MVSVAQIGLRAFEFIFTLLLTALVGNALNDNSGSPASVNFAMFVAALCWIVVLYGLVAAFVESLAIPFVLLVLDALATVFTFIAAIVLSAKLGVHSCTNDVCQAIHSLAFRNTTDHPLVIPCLKPLNKRKQLPHTDLPRATSQHGFPLVPVRSLRGIHGLLYPQLQGLLLIRKRWPQGTIHVAGLSHDSWLAFPFFISLTCSLTPSRIWYLMQASRPWWKVKIHSLHARTGITKPTKLLK